MSVTEFLQDFKKNKKGLNYIKLSDENAPIRVKNWISTGSIVLDAIMGGGLPAGRIVECYGDESSGKTLIACQIAKALQDKFENSIVFYADSERALSIDIIEGLQIDQERFIVSSDVTIEHIFSFFHEALEVKRKNPNVEILLVWDSIAGTTNLAEEEAEFGKATMGRHAMLISQGLRKLTPEISNTGAYCLFLNQIREKIGVMFGDKIATFGGKAIAFHASVRILLKNSKKIKDGKRVVGRETIVTVSKNKIAIPFRTARLPIYFGGGIDNAESVFMYLKEAGYIDGAGSRVKLESLGIDSFRKSDWEKIYESNREAVDNLVMNVDSFVADDAVDYSDDEESEDLE